MNVIEGSQNYFMEATNGANQSTRCGWMEASEAAGAMKQGYRGRKQICYFLLKTTTITAQYASKRRGGYEFVIRFIQFLSYEFSM
jgi:hypothetical protein